MFVIRTQVPQVPAQGGFPETAETPLRTPLVVDVVGNDVSVAHAGTWLLEILVTRLATSEAG